MKLSFDDVNFATGFFFVSLLGLSDLAQDKSKKRGPKEK